MNFKKFESDKKLRGGYYTPKYLCDFISSYVVDKNCKDIFEPSFGDGNFFRSAIKLNNKIVLNGNEINKKEFSKFKVSKNAKHQLHNSDFLNWYLNNSKKKFDGILGNPPFVRYQYLDDLFQKNSEKIFKKFNLDFTMHTNLWVPFFIASIDLLKPGKRIGMVIPNEILYLPHAKSLRKFLKLKMSKIIILDCNELLFEDTLQGTSIIFATKKIKDNQDSFISIKRIKRQEIIENKIKKTLSNLNFKRLGNEDKWMVYLLNKKELEAYDYFKKNKNIKIFNKIAKVDVGIVTGANNFFLINNKDVIKNKLKKYTKPMFGRSGHCKGIIYDKSQHESNIEKNLPVFFLEISKKTKIDKNLKKYIASGEKKELHNRYKCRIREPWYAVPSVYSTSLALLKRCHKFPRLIFNKINAYTTDTAYRIKTKKKYEKKLSFCFINSLTALSSELNGRHYGGGVLELTPSEIEKVLIPMPPNLECNINELNKNFNNLVDDNEILVRQDKIISKSLKVNIKYFKIIHKALLKLQNRRLRNG